MKARPTGAFCGIYLLVEAMGRIMAWLRIRMEPEMSVT